MRMEFFKKYLVFILMIVFGFKLFAQNEKAWQKNDHFYKRFQVENQNTPLTLTLRKINDEISGNYIDSHGKMIFLEAQKRNPKSNSSSRYLFNPKNKTEQWRIRWNEKDISMEKRKDSAEFIEVQVKEILSEKVFSYQVCHRVIQTEDKAGSFKVSYVIPQLNSKDASSELFHFQLKKQLEIQEEYSISLGIKKKFKDFQSEYDKSLEEHNLNEEVSVLSGSWEYFRDFQILWNDFNYLTLADNIDEYYGGAHGMRSLRFIHFDFHKNRLLELKDIIAISTQDLEKELEKQFRKTYRLKSDEELTKILFENHIKPTKNFRFDQTGIYFVYNPYEIAPYAMGKIEIFIPFKNLEANLRNEFKTRMKINLSKNKFIK